MISMILYILTCYFIAAFVEFTQHVARRSFHRHEPHPDSVLVGQPTERRAHADIQTHAQHRGVEFGQEFHTQRRVRRFSSNNFFRFFFPSSFSSTRVQLYTLRARLRPKTVPARGKTPLPVAIPNPASVAVSR